MSTDNVALIGSLLTIFGTLVTLAVWMVKQSSKRNEVVTDRFIKHMEDSAAAREAEAKSRAEEREQFLQSLHDNNDATRALAEAVRDLRDSFDRHSARLDQVEKKVNRKKTVTVKSEPEK